MDRISGLRPNPNLGQPKDVDNSQTVTYYGWQNSLRKRLSSSFSFDVNYTWSKALSNGGGDTGAYYDGENSSRNQEFFDLKADRGPYGVRHHALFQRGLGVPVAGLDAPQRGSAPPCGRLALAGILTAQTGSRYHRHPELLHVEPARRLCWRPALLPDYHNTLQYLNPAAFQRIPVSSASGAPIRPGNVGPGEPSGAGSVESELQPCEELPSARDHETANPYRHVQRAESHESFRSANQPQRPLFGQLLSTQGR